MVVSVLIHDVEYVAKENYTITEPSGAVATSTLDVRIDSNNIPQSLEDVLILMDGVPYLWGIIQTVESPEFNSGLEVITVRITVQSGEVILNNRLASESFRGKYTHEIVQAIFDGYIADEGITLGKISTSTRYYASYTFAYTKVFDILTELADDIGASFRIDGNKRFYFVTRDDMVVIDAPAHINKLKLEESAKDIRTVQIVTGATEETTQQTEQCYWANGQSTMLLKYPVSAIIGMTINGITVGFGITGIDETNVGATFLYNSGSTIALNQSATTKPATGDNVVIVYKGLFDIVVTNENAGLRGEIANLNGTSGRIDSIYTDETIDNFQDADSVAENLLSENAEREKTISCTCHDINVSNLFTVWRITFERFGISGSFVITERSISKWYDNFVVKVKLKNKGFNSKVGTTFKTASKNVGENILVYKMVSFGDKVSASDYYVMNNAGIIFFPSEQKIYFDNFYPV